MNDTELCKKKKKKEEVIRIHDDVTTFSWTQVYMFNEDPRKQIDKNPDVKTFHIWNDVAFTVKIFYFQA